MNEFNKYLGQNLNAKLIQTVHDPTHFMNNTAANVFCIPTCPTEIINIVHSNNSKKSGDYDCIDPNIIQHVIPQIANQLAHIFNSSFTMPIVPRKLEMLKLFRYAKVKALNCLQITDLFRFFHAYQHTKTPNVQ